MELENIILSKVNQIHKAKGFLSYVKYRPHTNISNIIYPYKYIQNMYPTVGLTEETKGGGKEGMKDSE
jgi:hypothetical protein